MFPNCEIQAFNKILWIASWNCCSGNWTHSSHHLHQISNSDFPEKVEMPSFLLMMFSFGHVLSPLGCLLHFLCFHTEQAANQPRQLEDTFYGAVLALSLASPCLNLLRSCHPEDRRRSQKNLQAELLPWSVVANVRRVMVQPAAASTSKKRSLDPFVFLPSSTRFDRGVQTLLLPLETFRKENILTSHILNLPLCQSYTHLIDSKVIAISNNWAGHRFKSSDIRYRDQSSTSELYRIQTEKILRCQQTMHLYRSSLP